MSLPARLRAVELTEAPACSLASQPALFQALELMDALASTLASLPAVLLAEVVRWLPSPLDVARLDCTSRLFHLGAPRSAVEEGLRMRAEAAGRVVEAALPVGDMSWTQCLIWEERRLMACAPPVASCGVRHSAFVGEGGQLLTCGSDNGWGFLGQGEGVVETAVPRAVTGPGGVRIRTVAAGFYHTLACSDEGVAYSFGHGVNGQLGHGDTADQHSPQVIEALLGVHISAVAASAVRSLALSRGGALYSFGYGVYGALGHGDRLTQLAPRLVEALKGVLILAVAVGYAHSLVLSDAGALYSFGHGEHGPLGHGDQADQLTPRLI